MCGRFTLTTDPGVVARRFGAPPTQGGGTTPRYNVAPTQTVVTVTDEGDAAPGADALGAGAPLGQGAPRAAAG